MHRRLRNKNKQGTRGKNKQIIDGGTTFYSGVSPGVRIVIGAPFRWDRVRADDDFDGVGAPPIQGCELSEGDLPGD